MTGQTVVDDLHAALAGVILLRESLAEEGKARGGGSSPEHLLNGERMMLCIRTINHLTAMMDALDIPRPTGIPEMGRGPDGRLVWQ